MNKRPVECEIDSSGSYKTKQAASMGTKSKGDSTLSAEILEALLCLDDAERHTKPKWSGKLSSAHLQGTMGISKWDAFITGLLLACKGLTTLLHSLLHLEEGQALDFVILTNARLSKTPRYRKKLIEAVEDDVVHTNCKRDTPNMRGGQRIGAAW